MHRSHQIPRGGSRPPSAPPINNLKRKERDYEQDTSNETNINVVVRCRGRNDREVRENSGVVVSTTGVKGTTVELSMGPNAISNKTYSFDKVFSPAADQAIIFDDVVSPILSEMLAGFNCTIFAYGQTGTGKTYTMSGDMTESCGLLTDAAGIIPRVLQSLFQKLEADESECTVKCSFIELYNEELRDLLSTDDSVKLKIYDDTNKKGHSATIVQGMEESHITNAAEGINKLQEGSHRRQVAATKCNDLSSRSHTVFTITTYVKKAGDSTDDYICSGKLNLVDLAGSENIQRSGAENKRATEAGLINKSLLTLGRVINALVDKGSHIPYRESKLTRLLQDSLGGRTKTCIIATVSPARSNLEETISTLDYAFRAKNIRNKPQVNTMISKKTLLKEFTAEIEKLKSELIATRQRNGVYLSNEKFEEMTIESESRRILSEEQRARIETIEVSLRNKVQELFALTNSFTLLKKDTEFTRSSLETTKDVLQKTEIVLAHTKEDLEEETKLRQKYTVTESKLHDVGHELLSTIDATLRDVDGLHSKLRRRSALHSQNQQQWETTRGHERSVLGMVDSNLETLEQEHSMALEATSQRIQAFVSQELERTKQAQFTIEAGLSALETKARSNESQSSAARDKMNDVLEEIKTLRDEVKAKVGDGLNGLSDAAAKISGEVISELDQFHSQLHASYSGLGKEIKSVLDDLSKQLQAQRDESDRLRCELQNATKVSVELSRRTAKELDDAIELERKTAEEERAQLLLQISTLVDTSMRSRDERLGHLCNSTKTGVSQVADLMESSDKSQEDALERWNEQDSTIREKVAKSKEEMKTRFKKDWAAVSDRNTKIQESTKAVHGETVKIVDAQVVAMATQMAALDEFVARARKQNDNHHEQHISSLGHMTLEIKDSFDKLQSRLSMSATENFNIGINAHIDEIASTFADVQDNARAPLHQLQDHLNSTHMRNYVPTGQTPQRKEWSYPTDLPRTIPLPPSTTPASKPPSSNPLSRAPARSPRKFASSPRKSPKKQIVRADTPPSSQQTVHHSQQSQELTMTNTHPIETPAQLKELDTNISSSAAATTMPPPTDSFSSTHSTNSEKVSITTTTSRLPTKAPAATPAPLNTKSKPPEQLEKENIPATKGDAVSIVPIPVEKGRHEKLSKSFYVPRLTRAAAAGKRTEFGRSMSG